MSEAEIIKLKKVLKEAMFILEREEVKKSRVKRETHKDRVNKLLKYK